MKTKRFMKTILSLCLCATMAAAVSVSAFAQEAAPAPVTPVAAAQPKSVAPPAKIKDVFPDPSLAAVMAKAMDKTVDTVVTADQLSSVGYVDGSDKGIYSLEGMQYVKKAAAIYLDHNHILDCSPLNGASVTQHYAFKVSDQTVRVAPVKAAGGNIRYANPAVARYPGATFSVSSVSDRGSYDKNLGTVSYYDLQAESGSVSFFAGSEYSSRGGYLFSVTVTIPYTRVPAGSLVPPARIAEIFSSPALAQAMVKALGAKDMNTVVTEEQLAEVGAIEANGKGISTLNGMQYVKRAASLDLGNNKITDISYLRNFEGVSENGVFSLQNQSISLDLVQVLDGTHTMENPIIGRDGTPCSNIADISNNGVYDAENNVVRFVGLPQGLANLTFQARDWYDEQRGYIYTANLDQTYYYIEVEQTPAL